MDSPQPDLVERVARAMKELGRRRSIGMSDVIWDEFAHEAIAATNLEYLQAQVAALTEALECIWREWSLRCDPNDDFPDWPQDAMAVMNDAFKNGFPEKVRAALTLKEQAK